VANIRRYSSAPLEEENMKKLLSLTLVIVLIFTLCPLAVLADAGADEDTATEANTIDAGAAVPDESGASSGTFSGSVLIAYNTSTATESQVSGSFSGTYTASSSSVMAKSARRENVYDERTDENTGKTYYLTEPDLPVYIPSTQSKGLMRSASAAPAASYAVNTERSFLDDSNNNRSMKCLYVGSYCTVWGCTSDPGAIDINATQAASIGQYYDGKYAAMTSAFGTYHYDVDGDGKVAIMCYDIDKNFETNPNVNSYTGGFFWSYDMYSEHNGLDCIHIDTFPGMGGNASTPLTDVSGCYSTLFHEFQHMINYSYQVKNNYAYGEMETYLNEAFSMAAEHLICGTDSVSTRVSFFNNYSSQYSGNPLTYWMGDGYANLYNYSTSYLFGQYVRTRYAQVQGGDGSTIYKKVLESRSSANDGDTLGIICNLLGTSAGQLVADFWRAVYLKSASGLYGFNGEAWADSISPYVYSASQLSSLNTGIYNSGCRYFDISGGSYTVSSSSNMAFERPSMQMPAYAAPTNLTAVYGNTLSSVNINGGNGSGSGTWSWMSPSTAVGYVGTHTFKAKFTPSDTSDYYTVTNIDVNVAVNADKASLSADSSAQMKCNSSLDLSPLVYSTHPGSGGSSSGGNASGGSLSGTSASGGNASGRGVKVVFYLANDGGTGATLSGSVLSGSGRPGAVKVGVYVSAIDVNGDGSPEYAQSDTRFITVTLRDVNSALRSAYETASGLLNSLKTEPAASGEGDPNSIYVSANGKDTYSSCRWTTQANADKLQAAYNAASYTVNDPASADSEETAAATKLNSAVTAFNRTLKNGSRVDADEIRLNVDTSPDSRLELACGKSYSLKVTAYINGSSARTTESYTFAASDTDIVGVDAKGKITAISNGDTAVNVVSTSGKTAQCYVHVMTPTAKISITDAEGARLSKATMTYNGENTSVTLYAQATEGHTDSLTWSIVKGEDIAYIVPSPDGESCTVTSNGSGGGSVSVMVKSGSGKSARCTVTIGGAADSLNVTESRYVVATGGNLGYDVTATAGRSLTLKVTPVCRDGVTRPVSKNVVWSVVSAADSNGNSVNADEYIEVSAKGAVKGLQPCRAIIRAAAEAGSADCQPVTFYVTVYPVLKSVSFAQDGTRLSKLSVSPGTALSLSEYLSVVWSDYGSHDDYCGASYQLVSGTGLDVTDNGTVTVEPGAAGTARIKVTVTSGTQVKTATLTLTIG
jgi:hypothetical protein